jgi:glutamine cyclotransferase
MHERVTGVMVMVAAALAAPSAATGSDVPALGHEVLARRPHDPTAYTQGLLLDDEGRLFESTGRRGRSSVREVDRQSGDVLRLRELPDSQFGEGLALVDGRLVQLTWREGVASVWHIETFDRVATFEYEGEGWGLCFDGERLVMSDGSDRLTFRDQRTFEPIGGVDVTIGGSPQALLNELECVDGAVWANVFATDTIVRIDPGSGEVTGTLDLAGIIDPHPADTMPGAVLNGIAHDSASGSFLVTGKLWPELIEIRVLEAVG